MKLSKKIPFPMLDTFGKANYKLLVIEDIYKQVNTMDNDKEMFIALSTTGLVENTNKLCIRIEDQFHTSLYVEKYDNGFDDETLKVDAYGISINLPLTENWERFLELSKEFHKFFAFIEGA